MNKKLIGIIIFMSLILSGCNEQVKLRIATATTIENSGLMQLLVDEYESYNDIKIEVIAVGTGAGLELGRNNDVDLIIGHSKDLELQFIEDGYGIKRSDFIYNDFIFVGPANEQFLNINELFDYIKHNGVFYSRGDNSGTNIKEKSILTDYNIDSDDYWYKETGQGMGNTLNMASLSGGFTLTDRGTFLFMKDNVKLYIMFEDVKYLRNQYGITVVDNGRNDREKNDFYKWLLSNEAKDIINSYNINNEQLFYVN